MNGDTDNVVHIEFPDHSRDESAEDEFMTEEARLQELDQMVMDHLETVGNELAIQRFRRIDEGRIT